MPLSVTCIIHIILAIEIFCIEIIKRKKGKFFFDFLTIANIFFLISYSITPLFYILFTDLEILPDNSFIDNISVISLFAYQVFLMGWFLGGSLKPKLKINHNHYVDSNDLKWLKLSTIFLVITAIFMVLIIISKGGVATSLGGALSRYSFEDTDSGGLAFLSRLTNIAPFLAAIFFYFLIEKSNTNINKKTIKFLFFIALSLSLFQIFSGASRGGMLRLIVLLGLVYISVNKRIKILPTVLIIAFSFIFITYGKQTFYSISNYTINSENIVDSFVYLNEIRDNAEKTGTDLIFREFSHPYKSVDTAIRYEKYSYEYTFFKDFFWSILRIIPSRFISIFTERPDPINITNTSLMTGVIGSGGIPPGLIASFYYSLGIFGVIIGFFLYGLLGRKINNKLSKKIKTSSIYLIPFSFFAYYYGFFVVNGDPNVYIYYILMPIVFLICIGFVKEKKRKFKK